MRALFKTVNISDIVSMYISPLSSVNFHFMMSANVEKSHLSLRLRLRLSLTKTKTKSKSRLSLSLTK